MRIFYSLIRKTTICLTIVSFMTLMCGGVSYAGTSDTQRKLKDGSGMMAPGYLNADKQRAESIKESVRPALTTKQRIEKIDSDLETSLLETKPENVRVNLKGPKKVGEAAAAGRNILIGAVGGEGDLYKDLDIGSGENQEYYDDAGNIYTEDGLDRWLASEEFDGVRHVYAGFSDYEGSDAIQQAINRSVENDVIIVREGEYSGFTLTNDYGNGITLYGGYRADGIRDVQGAATTITINDDSAVNDWIFNYHGQGPIAIGIDMLDNGAEINGFHIQNNATYGTCIFANTPYGAYDSDSSYYGVTLANNVITGNGYGGDAYSVGIEIYGYDGGPGAQQSEVRLYGNTIADLDNAIKIGGAGATAYIDNSTIDNCYNGIEVLAASSLSILNNDINTEGFALNVGNAETLQVTNNNLCGEFDAVSICANSIQLEYNNINGGEGIGIIFDLYGDYGSPVIRGNDICGATAAMSLSDYSYITGENNYIDGDIVNRNGQYGNGNFEDWSPSSSSVLGGVDVGINNPMAERTFQYGMDTTSLAQTTDSIFTSDRSYSETLRYGGIISFNFDDGNNMVSSTTANAGKIIQGLLGNMDMLMQGIEGEVIDAAMLAALINESLGEEFLQIGLTGEFNQANMEIAMMLAAIMRNPTEEQKVILDALASLFDDAKNLEGTDNPELKKASDDFTQMVTTVLLAQAIPDLLKEGDISSINGMFGELDSEKSHILLAYNTSVKIYYNNVVKELAANITTLQIKNLLSRDLTEKELEKLPTQRIDEIVNKIRDAEDKTITEEQILKVEAKYREESLIPAKKILEKNMKTLLQGFTQKLFNVLDGAGLVKENTVAGKPAFNIDLSAK